MLGTVDFGVADHRQRAGREQAAQIAVASFADIAQPVLVGHGRRQLLWFAVTRYPTAEWLAQQIVEAFPWDTAPTYLVRDNDGA